MNRRTGTNRTKVIDMLGLLVRAPRTVTEISDITGMDRSALYPWLYLMMEEGLLRRENISRTKILYRYYWTPPTCTPQD